MSQDLSFFVISFSFFFSFSFFLFLSFSNFSIAFICLWSLGKHGGEIGKATVIFGSIQPWLVRRPAGRFKLPTLTPFSPSSSSSSSSSSPPAYKYANRSWNLVDAPFSHKILCVDIFLLQQQQLEIWRLLVGSIDLGIFVYIPLSLDLIFLIPQFWHQRWSVNFSPFFF